jgi:CRP/FNR family cyclic AMP-dependent transcriptional regulator
VVARPGPPSSFTSANVTARSTCVLGHHHWSAGEASSLTQTVPQAARGGFSFYAGAHSVIGVASPEAMALTPITIVVTLLWWATTSPVGLTFEKKPHDETALAAAVSGPLQTTPATTRSKYSDVHQALIACGIFSRTSPEVIKALSQKLNSVCFSRGRAVSVQRDFGGCLYVIISGKVKVSHRHHEGGEIVLKILGPSETFGTLTSFDPGPQYMSMTTLTDVVAVPIGGDQLLAWMIERPEVCDQVLRLFARRIKAMTNSLVDLAFADAQGRVASRLLLLKQRFGRQDGEVVRVTHDLTADDFSDLAGVDAETVVATLRGFEDNGWIRLEERSIVIVDGHALSQVRQLSMGGVSGV